METGTWLIVAIAIGAVVIIAVVAGLAVLYADYRAARMNPPLPPGRRTDSVSPHIPEEPAIRRVPPRQLRFGPVDANPRAASNRSSGPKRKIGFTLDTAVVIPEHRLRCPFCTRLIEQDSYIADQVIECATCKTHYHRECFEFIGGRCQMH